MGCGSTLGNLLRFASSQSRPFRFDVDLVGDTVFFVRREISPTAIIQDLKGYGHTFPEEYTTWDADVSNSCSHQRIVQYEFGGLRLLLRSETDGYLPSKESGQPVAEPAEERSSLLGALGSMSVGGNEMPSQGRNLELRMQGTVVSQDSVFDIKTRMLSPHKIYDMGEILPRLWMNQTPNFLLAYHRYGLFNKPTVKDVRSEIKNWETENASTLGKFHAILKRIVDTVRESDVHQVEVSWDGQGPLRITEQLGEGRRALPLNLCSHWESME